MGRWHKYDDQKTLWKDLLIAWKHPRYDGMAPIDALADLNERRKDDRRRHPNYE